MRSSFYPLLLLMPVLLCSCGRTGIIDSARVELANPQQVETLVGEQLAFPDESLPERLFDLQIVSDTILVLQSHARSEDSFFFRAYSLPSISKLGSFAHQGRGPGELLSPHLPVVNPDKGCLFVIDNSKQEAYASDILASVSSGRLMTNETVILPVQTSEWLPLSDTVQVIICIENREQVLHVNKRGQGTVRDIHPYKYLDGEKNLTQLSSLYTFNGSRELVAECMVCFPQINFYDTQTGRIHSVAVDKAYRKWEHILNSWTSTDSIMNSKQYYAGVTSSSDYIFATYLDCSVSRSKEEGHGASIHVFDWDGHFLADLHVREDIGPIAYDPISGHLYGIDTVKDQLIRYTVELPEV